MINHSAIVVLGSTGFIGSSFEKFIRNFDPNLNLIGSNLQKTDLSIEENCLRLSHVIPDNSCLVVCAGIKKQYGDTFENLIVNNKISDNIAKLILSSRRIKKVVYLSSAEVYGFPIRGAITEKTQISPVSYYGIHKMYMEGLISKVCKERGVSYCFPRPPLVYGNGDKSLSYGPTGFISKALLGEEIVIWGDGKELREFIYIDDLSRILVNLVVKECNINGPLNIVSGRSYSYQELIYEIRKLAPNVKCTSKLRTLEQFDLVFDPTLIEVVMPSNFKFTSLSVGLAKMYASKDVIKRSQ